MTRLSIVLALSASFAALAAPALAEDISVSVRAPASSSRAHERISDPLEGFNRRMFAVDKRINRLFGRKKVAGSRGVIPRPVRHGLFNFFNNLDEPATFANDTLQLKFGKAAVSAGRFATNSTIGLFGTFDVAKKIGMRRHREDLGQTLAMYGVKAGPYIYLPIFGPSTLRDKVGDQVDGMTRPMGFVDAGMVGGRAISTTRKVVQPHVVSVRERASNAADNGQTVDEYATLREFYYQQRAAEFVDAPGSDNFTSPDSAPPPLPAAGVQHALQTAAPSYAFTDGDNLVPEYGDADAAMPGQDAPDARAGAADLDDIVEQAQMDAAFDAANPPPLPPAQGPSTRVSRRAAARP